MNERSNREREDDTLDLQKADRFFSNTCEIIGAFEGLHKRVYIVPIAFDIGGKRCVIEFCN